MPNPSLGERYMHLTLMIERALADIEQLQADVEALVAYRSRLAAAMSADGKTVTLYARPML